MDDPFADRADELAARVKPELQPGERLLWAGQPVSKRIPVSAGFRFASAVTVVFFLLTMLCFVAIFRNPLGQIEGLLSEGLASFVVAFVVTLGLIASMSRRRKLRDKLANTLYALTDRRAIIWMPETEGKARGAVAVYTFPRGIVGNVHRVEYPDGTGDVRFDLRDKVGSYSSFLVPRRFEGIADVRKVEEQVRRILVESDERREG